MDIRLVRTPNGFVAADDESYEMSKRIEYGQVISASVHLMRNYEFHKKYFALISKAWKFLTEEQRHNFGNQENYRVALQIAAGFYEPVLDIYGTFSSTRPMSISFEKMDEPTFHDLYNRVYDAILASLNDRATEFITNNPTF